MQFTIEERERLAYIHNSPHHWVLEQLAMWEEREASEQEHQIEQLKEDAKAMQGVLDVVTDERDGVSARLAALKTDIMRLVDAS